MQGLCAEKKAIGPRKRFDCSTLQSIADKESTNRDQARSRCDLLKYCASFRVTIEGVGVTPVRLPARSPDLNAFAERWVKSVKEECLSKLILFGERSLRHALKEYVEHHHHERNHQGKDNLLLFPREEQANTADGAIRCRERLGGLLKFYDRKAA